MKDACFTKIQTVCGPQNTDFNVLITVKLFSSQVYHLVKILSVNGTVLEFKFFFPLSEVCSESLFRKNTDENMITRKTLRSDLCRTFNRWLMGVTVGPYSECRLLHEEDCIPVQQCAGVYVTKLES